MQNAKNEAVKEERQMVLLGAVFIGVLGVIGLFVAAALLGLPWYFAAIGSGVWLCFLLIVEAEAEDEILVEAYGPTKKEEA
jgi:hypothetical protein